jgi:hypothetical protein
MKASHFTTDNQGSGWDTNLHYRIRNVHRPSAGCEHAVAPKANDLPVSFRKPLTAVLISTAYTWLTTSRCPLHTHTHTLSLSLSLSRSTANLDSFYYRSHQTEHRYRFSGGKGRTKETGNDIENLPDPSNLGHFHVKGKAKQRLTYTH